MLYDGRMCACALIADLLLVVCVCSPLSGKGTQCECLISAYGLVHVSTGDLLRQHVKDGTEIGAQIRSYLDSGKLVPDALVTELTLRRLAEDDCETRGWILDGQPTPIGATRPRRGCKRATSTRRESDVVRPLALALALALSLSLSLCAGFPRTPTQAQSLIDAGLVVHRFVVLGADFDSLVDRVSGRRFDPKTSATYHMTHNPPPAGVVADRCVIRPDDRPEVMRRRLATYDATIAGVIRQFHDVEIVQCDSRAGIYDVFAMLVRCVDAKGTLKNVAIRAKSANTKRRLTSNL